MLKNVIFSVHQMDPIMNRRQNIVKNKHPQVKLLNNPG